MPNMSLRLVVVSFPLSLIAPCIRLIALGDSYLFEAFLHRLERAAARIVDKFPVGKLDLEIIKVLWFILILACFFRRLPSPLRLLVVFLGCTVIAELQKRIELENSLLRALDQKIANDVRLSYVSSRITLASEELLHLIITVIFVWMSLHYFLSFEWPEPIIYVALLVSPLLFAIWSKRVRTSRCDLTTKVSCVRRELACLGILLLCLYQGYTELTHLLLANSWNETETIFLFVTVYTTLDSAFTIFQEDYQSHVTRFRRNKSSTG